LAENGGSPHPAKEEPPPFLARRLPFCPGRGLICHRENPRSSESIENRSFSERILLFFSTKTSELFYFTPHPPLPEGVKKLISFFFTSFRRKPESSVFKTLAIDWTPVFTGVTAEIPPFRGRDRVGVILGIFSHLRGGLGRG